MERLSKLESLGLSTEELTESLKEFKNRILETSERTINEICVKDKEAINSNEYVYIFIRFCHLFL